MSKLGLVLVLNRVPADVVCFGDLADRHLHAQFMLNESLKLQSHTLASRQPWNGFSLGTATSALYTAVSKLNLNKISPRERTVAKLAGSVSVIAATRFAAIRADSGIAHDKSDAAFTVVAFHADASGPGELLFESIVVNRRMSRESSTLHRGETTGISRIRRRISDGLDKSGTIFAMAKFLWL